MRNSSPKPSRRFRSIALDGFEGAVARGDAGAAGRDDRLHCGVRELTSDGVAQQLRIVFHDRAADDPWPAALSSSTMARPPVSVSSVRVSLTVMT